jgi:hypothetical protein
MKKILLVASLLTAIFPPKAFMQNPFTQHPQSFVPVYLGASVFADYDRDGYLDFYVTGWRSQGGSTSAPSSYLYRNNGNGTFSEIATSIVPLGASIAAWGDFNNDGYPDLVVAGNTGASAYDARIYRNNGNGSFTDIQAGLTPLLTPSAAWGDLNNDGLPDLVLSGTTQTSTAFTSIYYNNGNETFTAATAGLPQLTQSAVAITDMNLDGLNDIILCGRLGTNNYISRIYLNNGDGTFTQAFSFEPARYPAIDFADFDADGLPDVIIQGGNNTDVLHTTLYKNLGGGNFQQITAPFTGVYQGWVAFGDYNNDGLADVAVTGADVPTGATRVTKLYTNNGNSTFTELTTAGFPALRRSMVQWGDANNDGRLDLLISGYFNVSDYRTLIFLNNASVANTPPMPPANLSATVDGNNVHLNWSAGSDTQTPSSALTYNLRVGTTPGGSEIVAAHALANGTLTVPRHGNQGQLLSKLLNNLPNGTYYWSVQSVDAGFMGSAFAPEQSFTVGGPVQHLVTFTITINGQALEDVKVDLPTGSIYTNVNGQAIFLLPEGNYPWFATRLGYRQKYGTVPVSGPTEIQLQMEYEHPKTLPFSENFNLAEQPLDWMNVSNNDNFERWTFSGNYASVGSAGNSGSPVYASLIGPELPAAGLSGHLRLTVSHRLAINNAGTKARIFYFNNTASLPTLELLAQFTTGTQGAFVDTSFLLPTYADLSSIRVMFEIEETTSSNGLWEIDQVSVIHVPPTSLTENGSAAFVLLPNPANEHVRLILTSQSNEAIIYDAFGRVVVKYAVITGDNTLDISSLSPGIYFVRLNNSLKSKKLIVR